MEISSNEEATAALDACLEWFSPKEMHDAVQDAADRSANRKRQILARVGAEFPLAAVALKAQIKTLELYGAIDDLNQRVRCPECDHVFETEWNEA